MPNFPTVRTTHATNALTIRNVAADVQIEPHDGKAIIVELHGPALAIDAIRPREERDTLIIEGAKKRFGAGLADLFSNRKVSGDIVITGMSITMDDSGICINGDTVRNDSEKPRMLVFVPRGTQLDLSAISGSIVIGDTDGGLRLSTNSSEHANIGTIRNAHLTTQASGDIMVKRVNGTLTARTQGSGVIRVGSGEVTNLDAATQGSGSIWFDGTAQTAKFLIQGSGSITVQRVIQPPSKHVQGNGDIRVLFPG